MADLIAGNGKLVFLDDNGDSAGDMVGGYPPLVYYKARKTSVQTFGDFAEEYISFNTADIDTHNFRQDSLYCEVPQDGLYRISTQVAAEATYIRDFVIGILKSTDSSEITSSIDPVGTWITIDTTGERYYGTSDQQGGTLTLSSTHSLSAGDRLTVRGVINTTSGNATIQSDVGEIPGGSIDFNRDGYLTWFEVLKVGNAPS